MMLPSGTYTALEIRFPCSTTQDTQKVSNSANQVSFYKLLKIL